MRVGLDLRAPWLGGLYYLQNLARAVSSLPADEQPALLGFIDADDPSAPHAEFFGLAKLVLFRGGVADASLPGRVRNRALRALGARTSVPFGLERAVARNPVDVLFPRSGTSDDGIARLPWIPDLQHVDLPHLFSPEERSARDDVFAEAIASSRVVVVSSQVCARQVAERYADAASKLRVLHFRTTPAAEWLETAVAAVGARNGLPERYVLIANQLWRHKNHLVAFEAVRLTDVDERIHVVCTGTPDDPRDPEYVPMLRRLLSEHGLSSHVSILGVVPRLEYVALLRGAHAVVQPSLYEGWSSVVEDARALGKRLVLSDIPVHREQDPPGAIYVDPNDPAAMAQAIAEAVDAGPAASESLALERQVELVADYARTFLSIAQESLALLGPTP